MDERLRPVERLQTGFEFKQVFERGRCFRAPFLRVHYRASRREFSRLGLVVTRRLGKAVKRNRIKRLLRDVFRRNKSRLPGSMDVVLVPQREPQEYREYRGAFLDFVAAVSARGSS